MIYCFSQFCELDSFFAPFGIDWSHSYSCISLGAWLGVEYPRWPLMRKSLFNRPAWVLFFFLFLFLNYSLESVLFCISFRGPVWVSFCQGSWLPSRSISVGTRQVQTLTEPLIHHTCWCPMVKTSPETCGRDHTRVWLFGDAVHWGSPM